jgi:hypothetical protein
MRVIAGDRGLPADAPAWEAELLAPFPDHRQHLSWKARSRLRNEAISPLTLTTASTSPERLGTSLRGRVEEARCLFYGGAGSTRLRRLGTAAMASTKRCPPFRPATATTDLL